MKTFRVALLASVCFVGTAMAQEMKIDLGKLPPEVAAQLLKAEQDRKASEKEKGTVPLAVPTTVEQAAEYAKFGDQIAKGVAATAKGLSIEANEFVKTPVGWWTFIFIFWYFLGAKLWHIVGGILFWIASTAMIWKSLRTFHMPRKVLVSENGKEKKYEYQVFNFKSQDAKTASAVMHFITFAVATLVSLILVF